VLAIATLEVRAFRNLDTQAIALHPRFNVLAGDNGQGKTNTLEAIYLATTSRSFRTSSLVECVAHDQTLATVRARIVDDRDATAPPREQFVELGSRRRVQLDGKRPPTLASFALATPIVLFEPGTLVLSQGPAAERRKLLDRVAVHLAAASGGGDAILRDAERYRRAHLHRKRALEGRIDLRVVEPYERLMAEHGAAIVRARAKATLAIAARSIAAFTRIAQTDLSLDIAYAPRAPEDAETFATMLAASRERDARRGTASVGPHLDDLSLLLGGRPARQVASQGQHRALVLALKGAELKAIAEARDVQPILLLDDVSSELDPTRNAALFEFLHDQVGQVVLTTTRPELIGGFPERTIFDVRGGLLRRR
jgi:DNA replication and repair protein RecF